MKVLLRSFQVPEIAQCLMLKLLLTVLLFNSDSCFADIHSFAEKSLRIGFFLKSFPDVTRTDLDVGVKYWGEEIGKAKHIPVLINFYDDIEIMRSDFEQGKINYIVASAWVVATQFDRELLAEGFKASRIGISLDNLIVVTRKDTHLNSFKQLAGKKLGTLNNDPITDAYLDVLSMANFGKPYKQFFSKPIQETKSTKLVINLFFKNMDAIVTYQSPYELAMELNPQIKEQTHVIEQVSGIPWGTGYFHKKVDPAFRELVITEATKIKDNIRGQQLIQIFNADQFERSKLSDLDGTDVLKKRYLQLLHKLK